MYLIPKEERKPMQKEKQSMNRRKKDMHNKNSYQFHRLYKKFSILEMRGFWCLFKSCSLSMTEQFLAEKGPDLFDTIWHTQRGWKSSLANTTEHVENSSFSETITNKVHQQKCKERMISQASQSP
eukprot:GHVL01024283.1.p2 GENE.GHVL01024283.1~~GHVL01024283.1.p2  ORF type:complete len:125 (-),score=12.44 GHVL01024283.1:635-1009(-)